MVRLEIHQQELIDNTVLHLHSSMVRLEIEIIIRPQFGKSTFTFQYG